MKSPPASLFFAVYFLMGKAICVGALPSKGVFDSIKAIGSGGNAPYEENTDDVLQLVLVAGVDSNRHGVVIQPAIPDIL